MITVKSRSELVTMRRAGQIVAEVHAGMKEMVRPGISTAELDTWAESHIRGAGATPTFKGYNGFPSSLCISVNEEVIHGIPGRRKLKEGDLVSIDCGATYKNYVGDSAWSYSVGRVSDERKSLMEATEGSLWKAVDKARIGNRLYDIGSAVQTHVETLGYGIVRDYCGHGVGTRLHEDPQVPNYGRAGTGPRLKPGWVLAIEPMVTMGGPDVKLLKDDWTVVTKDGLSAAHFEHTIAITREGPIVLTALTDEIAYRFYDEGGEALAV